MKRNGACGSPKLRRGEIFPLDVPLGSISRMKSADVIFSAERRIGWFACQIFARRKVLICRQDEVATPLAARIDDGGRRPQAVPPHPRVPVVEPSRAQAHLCLALSESGSGDNNAGSFSGWPGDAFLPE